VIIAETEKEKIKTAGKPVFGKVVTGDTLLAAIKGEGAGVFTGTEEGEGVTCAISTCFIDLVDANLPVSKKYPTASADNTNPIVINLSHLGSSIWADSITVGLI